MINNYYRSVVVCIVLLQYQSALAQIPLIIRANHFAIL